MWTSAHGAAAAHCGRPRRGVSLCRPVLRALEDGDAAPDDAPDRAGVPGAPALVEPLSARELDVLRLLQSELSGPEIADRLVVALSTVRTHTKGIYGKLGVSNRRAAVRRAAELGLL
ncbi:MAG: helix-turn-helix transcriptional regulator [Caldilinea sp.]|nr:helix-turn-helix transcriptional regulator [Caldilinea sp.]